MSTKEKLEQENQNMTKITDINNVDTNRPHLSNLNQDPQLSRMINYSIDKERIQIGKRKCEPPNDVEIGGMGIRNLHAVITRDEEERIFIEPIFEGEDSSCYLNGDYLTEKKEMKTLDRLTFGMNNMFIVIIPEGQPRQETADEKNIDWDSAQN